MKTYIHKVHGGMLVTVLFLFFMGIFSFFRSDIADYAAWLLAMTHEISLSKETGKSGEASYSTVQIVSDKKFAAGNAATAKKTVAASNEDMFKKPVTADLPKTKTPVVSFGSGFPEWNDPNLTLFTPPRKYDGTVWTKEKTEIKGGTDGKRLYLICRFYDKNPNEAVTKYTEKDGKSAWQDDSIELFLMKDRKSDFYCQYIVSVSGKGVVLYYKNGKTSRSYSNSPLPGNFVRPHYNVNDFNGGFEIEMSIALSNIDVDRLRQGDSLLMQIVRNYRGQGAKGAVTLHLFPVYIYADTRLGINNHDRRAFQKVVVK